MKTPVSNKRNEPKTASSEDEKQKRLELNRQAAVKSRLKKKQELETTRMQIDFLTRAKEHLELKLSEYEKMVHDQTAANTVLKAQMYQLLMDNANLRAHLKEESSEGDNHLG